MSSATPGWPHRSNPLEQELAEDQERTVERELEQATRRHEAEAAHPRKRRRWWPFGRGRS